MLKANPVVFNKVFEEKKELFDHMLSVVTGTNTDKLMNCVLELLPEYEKEAGYDTYKGFQHMAYAVISDCLDHMVSGMDNWRTRQLTVEMIEPVIFAIILKAEMM